MTINCSHSANIIAKHWQEVQANWQLLVSRKTNTNYFHQTNYYHQPTNIHYAPSSEAAKAATFYNLKYHGCMPKLKESDYDYPSYYNDSDNGCSAASMQSGDY